MLQFIKDGVAIVAHPVWVVNYCSSSKCDLSGYIKSYDG